MHTYIYTYIHTHTHTHTNDHVRMYMQDEHTKCGNFLSNTGQEIRGTGNNTKRILVGCMTKIV